MSTMTLHAADRVSPRAEVLLKRIRQEFPGLSGQLQVIAQYVERHHESLALQGIRDVATHCTVHPSAVVRFAKRFGYSGYHELRQQFRESLVRSRRHSPIYEARVREHLPDAQPTPGPTDLAEACIDASIAALRELRRDLRGADLEEALRLIDQADTLWLLGSGRAFAVATYLTHALQQTDTPVQLVHQLGGMQLGQLRSVREGDVMIAVSFQPGARETLEGARLALERGARLIALTDDPFSSLAQMACVTLVHREASCMGFRSLACSMALAQALVVALAARPGATAAAPAMSAA